MTDPDLSVLPTWHQHPPIFIASLDKAHHKAPGSELYSKLHTNLVCQNTMAIPTPPATD